ncbi:MAG TPA: hypothetical protein VFB39_18505, partial [Solirubrobacteraceae bacterium]|nr:hypothetical protein [Solirubrobacteraceae bacterium]
PHPGPRARAHRRLHAHHVVTTDPAAATHNTSQEAKNSPPTQGNFGLARRAAPRITQPRDDT